MWMYGYICDMDADTGPHAHWAFSRNLEEASL